MTDTATASAGCMRTASGVYRPLVLVAHHGMYFDHETFATPTIAVAHAVMCIESSDSPYLKWHYHAIK